ncbi:MAG: DUF3429 domain-containing protein, partial [Pseudomonadota bacterium]
LWMKQLLSDAPSSNALLASNLILLGTWPAILLPTHWASLLMAAGFTLHLLIDPPWAQGRLPKWYRRLRLILSTSAIALLTLTALIGFGRVI